MAALVGSPEKDTTTGQKWAVDRWPFDQGENPAIQKIEEWYIPDDGSDPKKPQPTQAPADELIPAGIISTRFVMHPIGCRIREDVALDRMRKPGE